MTQLQASHPDLEVDIEAELAYYRQVRKEVVLMTTDTIEYINQALLENKKVLVEGERQHSSSWRILCDELTERVFVSRRERHHAGHRLRHLPLRDLFQPLHRLRLHWAGGGAQQNRRGILLVCSFYLKLLAVALSAPLNSSCWCKYSHYFLNVSR